MIIEKEVRDYLLTKNITGVGDRVYMELPGDGSEGDEYLLIQKTGNAYQDFLESPVIVIQSISKKSKYTAAFINELVKGAMFTFRDHVKNVFGCTLNTDYDFTNTQTKEYRYQSVWNMNLINTGGII